MITNIQYVVDNSGSEISVILPYSEREQLNSKYQKLQNKLEILQGIQDSMTEIRETNKSDTKSQTLTDFLNESRT